MNIFMWILAGGVLGWAGFVFWHFKEERGPVVSIIIGAVAATFLFPGSRVHDRWGV